MSSAAILKTVNMYSVVTEVKFMERNSDNGNDITLYYWPTSFYSQRVLMALYEKRVSFKSKLVSIHKNEQYESWFLRLNPRGEVPVLKDGIKVIPDSNRIIEYLEDNFCDGQYKSLSPVDKGSDEFIKVANFHEIIERINVYVLTYGSACYPELLGNPKEPFLSNFHHMKAHAKSSWHTALLDYADKNPEFKKELLAKASEVEKGKLRLDRSKGEVQAVLDEVDIVLQKVEEELASHKDNFHSMWLCGPTFSIADIDLAILLNRLYLLGYENMLWENGKKLYLSKYWFRIRSRHSFIRATEIKVEALRWHFIKELLKRNQKTVFSVVLAVGLAAASFILIRWHIRRLR